jgi:hypothetical protein
MNANEYDVCVIGAGSAGMAAAYALKNRNLRIAVIEQYSTLGGTAVNAWVETWIEGINLPYFIDVFNSLKDDEKAGILDDSWLPSNFSASGKSNGLVLFRDALAQKYASDLGEDKNISVFTGYRLGDVVFTGRKVTGINITNVANPKITCQITANYFIDSSGDGVLCRKAGCTAFTGEDPYERFGESLMQGKTPQKNQLNEPSLFFTIKKASDPTPAQADQNGFIYNGYRSGRWVNPMNGMGITGGEVIRDGIDTVYKKAVSLINDFWKFIRYSIQVRDDTHQDPYGYNDYDKKVVPDGNHAPMLGIRESYRIKCEYMLSQFDLAKKITSSNLENFIACGSLGIDFHNYGSLDAKEVIKFNNTLLKPSGIPYLCLIPEQLDNVLIACRAYGASHIALAARRTNKDMAQLGWAAGHAVRICLDDGLADTRKVDVKKLQGADYTDFINSVKKLEEKMNGSNKSNDSNR